MKKIKTKDGQIINGYEYNDFDEDIKNKLICDQIKFEIDIMDEQSPYYYLAMEMERMQTPWFLASCIYEKHKDDIIESIEINQYLFDNDGELLKIMYYTEKNKVVRITYNNIDCEII